MSGLLPFALSVFMGFFAVMNPIANTPVFLGLVADYSESEKKKIARKATITAFIIVTCFVFLGKYIFQLFGITVPAFKITGGVILFHIGFEMLISKKPKMHHQGKVAPDETLAISPLAIPILAGPGTIVTAMNNVTHGNMLHILIIVVIFAFMTYLTYLAFSLADAVVKRLGENIIIVISKIMGLILAIMGTEMIISGIKIAFSLSAN